MSIKQKNKGLTSHLSKIGAQHQLKEKSLKGAGFTLIELLIVIAVIAIIAGAVLVAVNPAKRINESNDSRRWSDVRSLSLAIGAFVTDNKGEIPNCGAIDMPNDGVYRCVGTGGGSGENYGDNMNSWDAESWWSFEAVGNPVFDQTVGANDLTNNNSVDAVADAVESVNSALFNGSTQWLGRADAAPLSANFPGKNAVNDYDMSVSAWVKIDSSGAHGIASKTTTVDNDNNSWIFGIDDFAGGKNKRVYVSLRDQVNAVPTYRNVNYIGSTSLTLNNWHHVAFTFERDTAGPPYNHEVVIYVDGMEDLRDSSESFFSSAYPMGSTADFNVGRAQIPGGSTDYLSGNLDELAVFDTVLTQDQIQEIFFFGLEGNRTCCDLTSDIGAYLTPLPTDPQQGDQSNTGYIIKRTYDNKIWIRAPHQSDEATTRIEVSR